MSAPSVTWGRSAYDGRVHAWTEQRWCGDAVAVCQHACPPQHVDCAATGPSCARCSERAPARSMPLAGAGEAASCPQHPESPHQPGSSTLEAA